MSRKSIDVMPILMMLVARFPATFSIFEQRRKPLQIGFHQEILKRLGDAVTAKDLSTALRIYAANRFYLRACQEGASRIDLDRNNAGTVSAEHAIGCQARLAAKAKRNRRT